MSSRYDPERGSVGHYVLLMASSMLSSRRSRRACRQPAGALPDDLPDSAPGACTQVADQETLSRLRRSLGEALQHLSQQELIVILLGTRPGLGSMSQREIGEILGLGDTAMHRLKKNALARLRQHVALPAEGP